MEHRSFLVSLSDVDRLRVEIFRKGHEIFEFVVQYEVLIGGGWREVVRYDNRGKPPHMDVFDVKGKRYKEDIPNIKLKELIPCCIGDLKENWESYKRRYIKWMK